MYPFLLKYREVIINASVFIFLLLASSGFHTDFFLGAACGAAAIALGESLGDLKKKKQKLAGRDEMPLIND